MPKFLLFISFVVEFMFLYNRERSDPTVGAEPFCNVQTADERLRARDIQSRVRRKILTWPSIARSHMHERISARVNGDRGSDTSLWQLLSNNLMSSSQHGESGGE